MDEESATAAAEKVMYRPICCVLYPTDSPYRAGQRYSRKGRLPALPGHKKSTLDLQLLWQSGSQTDYVL